MEFFDVLYQRQSIRSFTDKKLSQDEIKRLLDAAIHAPSACNMQSWYFYAVSDRGVLDTLCDKKGFADWAAKAPVVFVVCTDSGAIVERFGPRAEIFPVQDTALAVQNILLSARAMGLGGCFMGAFNPDVLCEVLSIPKKHVPVAVVPVGEPASVPPIRERKAIEEVVTFI